MIKWTRPSGSTIETNESEATIQYAVNAGWKRKEVKKAKKVKEVKETQELTES